jgi:N-acetylglucosamine-6-sulfatase
MVLWSDVVLPLAVLVGLCLSNATPQDVQQSLAGHKQSTQLPNVVFILTDDQDLHMESLSYMPHLKNHLLDRGTFYQRHYCTIALCCPSRVSLWTGKAAHNTNVTDVNPPYGLVVEQYPLLKSQS